MSDTMKIVVVSKESIKPSSPTPKTHNLSRFDQLFLPFYVDLLLYYPNLDRNDSNLGDDEDDKNMIFSVSSRRRCDVLKKSLAETLTRYYPLAGRIRDDKSIECTDEGVDYIETRVVGRVVSQVMQLASSDIEVMEPFLPYEPYGKTGSTFGHWLDLNSKALLKVQVNVFDCGGMIICPIYSHKIADGISFFNFLKDWAATARGASGTHDDERKVAAVDKPTYTFSSMFPPTTCTGFGDQGKAKKDIQIVTHRVTKRFVFKNFSIAKLKKKCFHGVNNESDSQEDKQEQNMQQLPTRFEALTSLIWMCFMDVDHRVKVKQIDDAVRSANAVNDVSAPKQVEYVASISINLRTRTIPPLPANSFGNMIDLAVAEVFPNFIGGKLNNNGKDFHEYRSDQYLPELVSKIKDSIKLVNNEYVEALRSNFAISSNKLKLNQKLREGTCDGDHKTTEVIGFSSWCRFPVYEADFGWGKPAWAGISKIPIHNFVMFMDTSSGDGIEAWVSLKDEYMVEFERHEELLAFAS